VTDCNWRQDRELAQTVDSSKAFDKIFVRQKAVDEHLVGNYWKREDASTGNFQKGTVL